jgi:hypothetical protein
VKTGRTIHNKKLDTTILDMKKGTCKTPGLAVSGDRNVIKRKQ